MRILSISPRNCAVAAAIALLALMQADALGMNKCIDAKGKVSYSQDPCPSGPKGSREAPITGGTMSSVGSGSPAKAAKPAGPHSEQEDQRRKAQQAAEAKNREESKRNAEQGAKPPPAYGK
jgi:uncharacterized protein DUF4124